ncbi:MAG: hypothetical protein QOI53_2677, partial [Verrucomicrobiota bacterium]|nr:hypothetical protein [Verrucomicrobiota bacterium]
DRDRPAAKCLHTLNGFRSRLRMRDIIYDKVSSFFREPQGDRLTDPLIATRN